MQISMRPRCGALFLLVLAALSAAAPLPACAQSAAQQQQLIQERETLAVQLAKAQRMYTPQHPRLLALRQQLAAQDMLIQEQMTPAQSRKATRKEQKKTQLEMARKRQALEEQLVDAQIKYSAYHPRVVALKQQIADCDRFAPPQSSEQETAARRMALLSQRAALRLKLSRLQTLYTDNAPQVSSARQQIFSIDRQLEDLPRK